MISKEALDRVLSMYDIRELITIKKNLSRDYLEGIQDVLNSLKVIYNEQLKSNSDEDSLVKTYDEKLGWIKREI